MKQWFRIELFDEDFITCLPEQEASHRLVMVERQYTSINRAWAAANRMAKSRPEVFFIRVRRVGGGVEYRFNAQLNPQ